MTTPAPIHPKHKTYDDIPEDAERRNCGACHAPLAFVYNPRTGKRTPVSLITRQSHFLDCPGADRFSHASDHRQARML